MLRAAYRLLSRAERRAVAATVDMTYERPLGQLCGKGYALVDVS